MLTRIIQLSISVTLGFLAIKAVAALVALQNARIDQIYTGLGG